MPFHSTQNDTAPPSGAGFDVYDPELEYRLGRLQSRHSNYVTQVHTSPAC